MSYTVSRHRFSTFYGTTFLFRHCSASNSALDTCGPASYLLGLRGQIRRERGADVAGDGGKSLAKLPHAMSDEDWPWKKSDGGKCEDSCCTATTRLVVATARLAFCAASLFSVSVRLRYGLFSL